MTKCYLLDTLSMVTTREIAARIGLSKSTVSLALRDDPRIPLATREKVRKGAIAMGYRPNPVLSQMMRSMRASKPLEGRATIGLLHGFEDPKQARTNPYHSAWVAGARARAEQLGYFVDELWIKEPGMSARRLTGIIRARGISALLIAPLPEKARLDLQWEYFCAVTAGHKLEEPRLSRVVPNHFHVILLCLEELCRLGYRRIGLVMPEELTPSVRFQMKAPVLWLQEEIGVDPVITPLDKLPASQGAFTAWLNRHRPDAVVSANLQVVDWVLASGRKIPEDIGVACTSLTTAPDGYSGVDQQPERFGAAATDLLVAQMNCTEFGVPANPKTVLTDVAWRPGNSLRQVGRPVKLKTSLLDLI